MHKAQAIIDYREQHGEFESINDLLHVKGIGPSTLERNGDSLLIE
jgi:competence protein ComEA